MVFTRSLLILAFSFSTFLGTARGEIQDRSIQINIADEVALAESDLQSFISESSRSYQGILDPQYSAAFYRKKMSESGFTKKALLTLPYIACATLGKWQEGFQELGYRKAYTHSNAEVEKQVRGKTRHAYVNIATGGIGFVVEAVVVPYAVATQILAHLSAIGVMSVTADGALVLDMTLLRTYLGVQLIDATALLPNLPRYIIFGGIKFITKNVWSGGVIAVVINLMNSFLGQYQAFINQEAEKAANVAMLEAFKKQKGMYPEIQNYNPEYFETIDFTSAQNTYYLLQTEIKAEMAALPRAGRDLHDWVTGMMEGWMNALNIIDTSITVSKIRIDQLLERKDSLDAKEKEELETLEKKLRQNAIQRYNTVANMYSMLRRRPEFKPDFERQVFRLGLSVYGEEYKTFLDTQINQLENSVKSEVQKKWVDYLNEAYYKINPGTPQLKLQQ